MQPKLSIIVPVYKVEPYIHQCLDSLVNQTMDNIEIICIDDGSPDNCGAICDEYAKFERGGVAFRVIHKKNEGIIATINDGIKLATGKYMTFVDSDDWVDIDFYERMFSAMGEKEAEVFCSGARYNEYGERTELDITIEKPFYYENSENRAYLMGRTIVRVPSENNECYLCQLSYYWDKIYLTSFLKEKVLGWNKHDTYGAIMDSIFSFCVFSKAERVGGCTETGYHYRKRVPGSQTNRYWSDLLKISSNNAEALYDMIRNDDNRNNHFLQEAFITRCQLMFVWTIPNYVHSPQEVSYIARAKEYREFKRAKYFKDSLKTKTSFDSNRFYLKLQLLRITGLWGAYVIEYIKKLCR